MSFSESTTKPRRATPAIERFWAKIEVSTEHFFDGEPCWNWTGYIHPLGYGQFRPDARQKHNGGKPQTSPHRFAYEHFIGDIPEDKEIDHLCQRKHCANPRHLEIVTRQVNLARRDQAQGHNGICPKHSEAKVRLGKKKSKLVCRSCARENIEKYRTRHNHRV